MAAAAVSSSVEVAAVVLAVAAAASLVEVAPVVLVAAAAAGVDGIDPAALARELQRKRPRCGVPGRRIEIKSRLTRPRSSPDRRFHP